MAVQAFSTSHALSVTQWAVGLEAEVLKKISFVPLIGKRSDSVIQWRDETSKSAGDTITFGLRMQLDESVAPKQGNSGLEGNERTLNLFSDSVVIDQVRDAVRWYGVIDQQRVTFEMREEARAALADFLSATIDASFFNQVCGYTVQTNTALTGNNSVTAPDADHQFWAGAATNDEGLTSSDTFSLALIDEALERVKTLTPAIRPAYLEGMGEYYVVFLHPYQVTALRASSSDWTAIQRDILRGGRIDDNPILTGSLGVYNGVVLRESTRVTQGVHSGTGAAETDVRRAVLCGAQAASIAWGRQGGNPERFRWVEKSFDFDNEFGVAAGCVYGLKKNIFNSDDFGTMVISTFAQAS